MSPYDQDDNDMVLDIFQGYFIERKNSFSWGVPLLVFPDDQSVYTAGFCCGTDKYDTDRL